jgi:hypothetical protein
LLLLLKLLLLPSTPSGSIFSSIAGASISGLISSGVRFSDPSSMGTDLKNGLIYSLIFQLIWAIIIHNYHGSKKINE